MLLALYLQATLDQYKRPEEVTNLIARLADSSFFQGQTLTHFYDKKILSLEEVMDLVKQYPGMQGEEIDSIRQLVKNRDNPNKNKELFENNKENSIFKDYIKNVFSKDFDREVRSIKEPQEALLRLRSYKLDANATKYLLGIVFKDDLSVDALARMINENLLLELGQIAKHNGTTLPARSKEVEAYYAIRRGAMGEFKPLIALGYPEKRVYDFP